MIGTSIRIARMSLGLTASDVARKAQLSKSYLSEIENGKRSPGFEILSAIAKACYVPTSQICRIAECLEAGEVLPFTATEFHRAIEARILKNGNEKRQGA